jgi:tetratricopeptide (TPR) repeat protein
MHKIYKLALLAAAGLFLFSSTGLAADANASQQHMRTCLKKATDLPDIAVAEADAWLRQGGGDAAILCRATAQFHNNEFIKSALDFTSLADKQKDGRQASLLYQQAALAWQRAEDYHKAEDAYGKALKLEQDDPDLWMARGNERAAAQHYWEAIDDLNKSLAIMPDMPEALRLRGQVWAKLGLEHNAETDFRHAGEVQAEEDVAATTNAQKKGAAPKAAVAKVSDDSDTNKSLRRGTPADSGAQQ